MMKNDKTLIFFGAGNEGVKLIDLFGKDKIAFFVDNDCEKQGNSIYGIPIYHPKKILETHNFEIYITVSRQIAEEIELQLKNMGIQEYKLAYKIPKVELFQSNEKISQLKNHFSKKRCFIIGTGPSLEISDLEKLGKNGEICFASNKIFKLFSKTDWRPLLYCVSDLEVFSYYYDIICNMGIEFKFLVDICKSKYKNEIDAQKLMGEHQYIFNILNEKKLDESTKEMLPAFSIAAERYVVDGGITVTYSIIQLAYFLGFTEMYLLGVDFSYGDMTGRDADRNDHFCEEYIEKNEVVNRPKIEESLKAYKVAEKVSREYGFRVYNATRGGCLEVFERVDFDLIL